MSYDILGTRSILCDTFCMRKGIGKHLHLQGMEMMIQNFCKLFGEYQSDHQKWIPISVYGVGEHSRVLFKHWIAYDCPEIANWVVSGIPKESEFLGKKVYSITDSIKPAPRLIVLSSKAFESEMADKAFKHFPDASVLSIWNRSNSRFQDNQEGIMEVVEQMEDAFWIESVSSSIIRKKRNLEMLFEKRSNRKLIMIGSKNRIRSFRIVWEKVFNQPLNAAELEVDFCSNDNRNKPYLPKYTVVFDSPNEVDTADLIFALSSTVDEQHSLLNGLRTRNTVAKIFCVFGESYNPL